jgi:hypothetical protein
VRRYYVHILTTEMKMTVEKNVIDTELLLIMTMTHNNGDRTLLYLVKTATTSNSVVAKLVATTEFLRNDEHSTGAIVLRMRVIREIPPSLSQFELGQFNGSYSSHGSSSVYYRYSIYPTWTPSSVLLQWT